MATFQSLLSQSRDLTAHIAPGALPSLERGLSEIEAQSRRLASKTARDAAGAPGGLAGAAQFMLAKRDFDAERLQVGLTDIDFGKALRAAPPVSDGDLEQFLEDSHRDIVLAGLDAAKERTWAEQADLLDRLADRAWENAKQRVFEELGQHRGVNGAINAIGRVTDAMASVRGMAATPNRQAIRTVTAPGAFPTSPTSPRPAVQAGQMQVGLPSQGQEALEGTSAGGIQLYPKMAQYASTIANLNNNRLSGMPFDLVQQLAETSKVLGGEKESFLRQAWDLLASILGPVDKERLLARGYSLQASAYTSADASSFRRKVARGARAFYEREFALLVDKKIQSNVSAARLSGPGARAQAVSYANLALRNRDRWALPGLELLGSGDQAVPLWAVLFYLMRMGKGEEAIAFAESESVRDKLERDGDSNLVAYLRYWVALSTNPDGEERAMRDQIANEFNARIKTRNSMDAAGTQQGDPFKLAVYKVLGRCELSRKMIPGPWVVVGTEDYVWLQLVLSREGDDLSGGETYGIRDMARHFIRFGPEYFNPAGNTGNPLVWFMVLLACGEFERAAAYLVAQDRYAVEGIHFAVTLAWAGVLRVPDTVGAGIELLGEVEVADAPPVSAYPSTPTITRFGSTIRAQVANNLPAYKLATFDFARLMHSYTRSFYRTDPKRALQYLYLICIYGKLDAGESDAQKTETYNSVAHRYIRDLVLDTREFGALLGSVRTDGTRVPGELEKFAPLLNLPTPAAFIASITKKAAEHAERDGGRFNDAVQLYNLAEDYDTVMRLINRYLGETLAQRQFAIAGVGMDQGVDAFGRQMPVPLGGSTGTGAIEEALRIASELAAYYDASPALSAKVSPEERETCSVLTSLLKFMQDYEEAKLESALQRQVDLGILPLDVRERTSRAEPTPTPAELMIIRRKALAVSSLNENVARSMPMIIVATMDCIYRLWRALRSSSFQDPARLAVAKEYKMMADNIVMFAGQMEYRMAPDVFSKLNRLAVVYMS